MILGVCVCARARGRARVRVRVFVCCVCVVHVLRVCVRVFFTRARARVCVARACVGYPRRRASSPFHTLRVLDCERIGTNPLVQ